VENACQAIGGDFLSHGLLVADEAGYETFAVIHDQALAPVKDGLTLEGYTDALCTLPDWAEGFPLAGDGGIVDFYTKD
jgi:DNA polymerase